MIISPILSTAGAVLTTADTVSKGVNNVLNFEHLSDTSLPYIVLSELFKPLAGKPLPEIVPQQTSGIIFPPLFPPLRPRPSSIEKPWEVSKFPTQASNLMDTHLPNERVWDIGKPNVYTSQSEDGSMHETITKIDFRTIDKNISSFENVNKLIDTIKQGEIPPFQQIQLAILDIVDMIDLGIMGDSISKVRLEPHVKNRSITVTETVSTVTEDKQLEVSKNLQQIGKTVETNTQAISLEGDNLGNRVLSRETYAETATKFSEITESPQSNSEKWLGGEVETTHRVFVKTDTSHTLEQADSGGELKTIKTDADTRTEDIHKVTGKEWKEGHITYIPLAGSATDIARKYQAGVKVTVGDWVTLGMDAACIALMLIPGGQVAAAGRVSGSAATKIATAQVRKGLAKAALKPKGAATVLKKVYSNPRSVFSPERIAAKARTAAHNPMKGDMLKTLAELSKGKLQGAQLKTWLRQEFADMGAEGKLIADTLSKNLRYLKQNGWLTPENINRMSQGLNPMGWLKEAPGKLFRLDVDHIIPKSLAAELKAHPGNLVFLPQIENMLKSNNMLRHVVQHVDKFLAANPSWKPSPALLGKVKDFIENHPNIPGLENIKQLLSAA